MTWKERMLNTLCGRGSDRVPWVPRLDLWYHANARAGTLPRHLHGAGLAQIIEDLDAGVHAVVPDFRDLRLPSDDHDRVLGIYNLASMPYHTILDEVERRVTMEGDTTHVEYRTPVGTLTTRTLYTEEMRQAGVTITHVLEPAVKRLEDLRAVAHIYEHAQVVPQPEGYRQFAAHVGTRGLAVGFVSLSASGMHLLQRELMAADQFFYFLHDHEEEMRRTAESIQGYLDRAFDASLHCEAPVLFCGANYDAMITYPPFFREHFAPALRRRAQALHGQGRFLLTHTDGENTGLLEHYLWAEIDIADSICPAPMTRLTLRQAQEALGRRVTIWGGIPSVSLLAASMTERNFEALLDKTLSTLAFRDHLIVSVADTMPPAAVWSRIEKIGRAVRQMGPVADQSSPN